MGKIITKGFASREVPYDCMKIRLRFNARERVQKDAIRKITEECEEFLAELKAGGVDLSQVMAGANSVEMDSYGDERFANAYRNMSIEVPYDLAFLDWIMQMVQTNALGADIDVEYSFRSKEEIRSQLMEEATENARKKAELMAKATGTKIAGVERIKVEPDNDYIFAEDDDENAACDGISYGGIAMSEKARGLYTELRTETATESAQVYIEWILE